MTAMAMQVWIEAGCIACRQCEAECPQVFVVDGARSMVRTGTGTVDGERVRLRPELAAEHAARIAGAADACPVSVIRFAVDEAHAVPART